MPGWSSLKSAGYHLVIGGLDSRLHSAYIQSDGIQDKSSFLLTKHLHHVSARIHEDVHITSFEVGAHTVGYDAAQTVEALAHVHWPVVQPVLHRAIQTKHCSLILSLAGALQSCFPECAWHRTAGCTDLHRQKALLFLL